eukprot:gene14717-20757_t
MSQAYNEDRPLFAHGKQTELYQEMSDYAYKPEVQELLQKLCADVFTERPNKPLDYMISWLNAEKKRQEMDNNTH